MQILRLFLALALAAAIPAHAEISTFPAVPMAGQEFVLRVTDLRNTGGSNSVKAEVEGNIVFLSYDVVGCGFLCPAPGEIRILMTLPRPGTYALRARMIGTVVTDTPIGSLTAVEGRVAAAPALALNGLWLVPSQPGWGVRITQGAAGQLFVVLYTYDEATKSPRWYVASGGTWVAPDRFVATFYNPIGPVLYPTLPFDSSKVSLDPSGAFTLTVKSADSMTFTVEGSRGFGPLINVTYELSKYRF